MGKENRVNVRMTDDEYNKLQEGLNEYSKKHPDEKINQTEFVNWCIDRAVSNLKLGEHQIKAWTKEQTDEHMHTHDLKYEEYLKQLIQSNETLKSMLNFLIMKICASGKDLKGLVYDVALGIEEARKDPDNAKSIDKAYQNCKSADDYESVVVDELINNFENSDYSFLASRAVENRTKDSTEDEEEIEETIDEKDVELYKELMEENNQ